MSKMLWLKVEYNYNMCYWIYPIFCQKSVTCLHAAGNLDFIVKDHYNENSNVTYVC